MRSVCIKGYEQYYCDEDGNVYGRKLNKLKPRINQRGYKYVVLCVNEKTKTFMVHKIIAETFVSGKTDEKYFVNHIDGNKTNNKANNLEWVTPKENTRHARDVLNIPFGKKQRKKIVAKDKQTEEIVLRFDSLSQASMFFEKENKKRMRHIQNTISQVANGKRKSYKNMIWEYI